MAQGDVFILVDHAQPTRHSLHFAESRLQSGLRKYSVLDLMEFFSFIFIKDGGEKKTYRLLGQHLEGGVDKIVSLALEGLFDVSHVAIDGTTLVGPVLGGKWVYAKRAHQVVAAARNR